MHSWWGLFLARRRWSFQHCSRFCRYGTFTGNKYVRWLSLYEQIRLISFCTCVRTSRFFGWVWRHVTYLQREFWRYKLSPPSVHKIYIFITGNTTNKCKYIYVNLLYYKQGGLLHVSVSYFGHLQGGVFWSVYYIERQNNLIYTNTHTHIYIYIYIVEFSSKSFKSILEYIFIFFI